MLQGLYPDHIAANVYEIDYAGLYAQGFRGVIYDIDNTLVPYAAPATPEIKALLQSLRALGFEVLLLSNNRQARVQPFAEEVGQRCIYRANKPFVANYQCAMQLMGTSPSTTLLVGDQLLTDIWGARRIGATCFLVQPICKKEHLGIRLTRPIERVILYFYFKQRKN